MDGERARMTPTPPRVALFRSDNRFEAFFEKFKDYGCTVEIMDFRKPDWNRSDFGSFDLIFYYPTFQNSSNHPLSLRWVKDNLAHIHRCFPAVPMFPDPNMLCFYGDKYLQHLFLDFKGLPTPRTIALEGRDAIEQAAEFGFPLVVKNRFGAGGDQVWLAESVDELVSLRACAEFRFGGTTSAFRTLGDLLSRSFVRGFRKGRPAQYPFLSAPLIAQEFLPHEADLKTVTCDGRVVEAHWREKGRAGGWKANIDGGGVGIWGHVPQAAIDLSHRLCDALGAKWVNADFLVSGDDFLISEFSPVWHHYKYKENPDFEYRADYNFPLDPVSASDLEELIVSSYLGVGPAGL